MEAQTLEQLRHPLHPWGDGMFDCGPRTFRTLEGAYQANRGPRFQAGYEHLSGGQAWARGARRCIPHRPEALRMAVKARFDDLAWFRTAIQSHQGSFHVWHQEPAFGHLLEILYAQLRSGGSTCQLRLPLDSPPSEQAA